MHFSTSTHYLIFCQVDWICKWLITLTTKLLVSDTRFLFITHYSLLGVSTIHAQLVTFLISHFKCELNICLLYLHRLIHSSSSNDEGNKQAAKVRPLMQNDDTIGWLCLDSSRKKDAVDHDIGKWTICSLLFSFILQMNWNIKAIL